MKQSLFVAVFLLVFNIAAHAADPKPLGNPSAKAGGTTYLNLDAEPSTLNPYVGATDAYSNRITGYVFDGLISRDIETYEFVPGIAERWEVAKDGKSITFYLRKDAVFSDGKPLTSEDVKFSFDAIFNPAYKAAMLQSYYENFSGVDAIDPYTVRFNIKTKYFQNLESAGGITILPKHIYGDPNKKMNKTAVGSGPYMLDKWDQGKSIVMVKNPKWFGWKVPYYGGYYKADTIHFRVIKDENAKLETFKRGEIDFLSLSPEQYFLKTKGSPWGTKVIAEKIENLAPKSTPFIGWNNKNPLFKDRDVRMALTYLYDREELAKKFFFGAAEPATGPWYKQNPAANPDIKATPHDPKKAREILQKAGWADSDKDGVLDKVVDGKKMDFRFKLLNPNKDYEKYFTVYKEDLKKAGIDMSITNIDWSAFQKKLDDKDFEALFLVWGGAIDYDPKQIWHSANSKKGGSNFISYNNPKVDELIDKARQELDDKKRLKMMQEIYGIIANDYPYTFLVNLKYSFYGHNSRMAMQQPTYKYGIGSELWWIK